jgi:transcriptional regulator with XRE-family HTH domain
MSAKSSEAGRTLVDAAVGRNVKLQRGAAGLSEGGLGRRIGVKLRQVLKYENGSDRIGVARLTQIAAALDVPVPLLFDGIASASPPVWPFASSPGVTGDPRSPLSRALATIADAEVRGSLTALVERIAAQNGYVRH